MSSKPFWKYATITNTKLPEVLYHYTTRAGMFGIISSAKIWASSSQFMNDASEFKYSTQLIAEIATELKKSSNNWFEGQLLGHAISLHTSDDLKKQVFIFSLSEKDDLLSQWRAYGNTSDAYAMGFSSSMLTRTLSDHNILLSACVYDRDTQVKIIKELIKAALYDFNSHKFSMADIKDKRVYVATSEASLAFIQAAVLIKHPSFAEEREWRLVRIGWDGNNLKFRPASTHFIPYIELPIAFGLAVGLFKEVVIGPSSQFELDALSLKWYFNEKGVTPTSIRSSSIPFRNQ